MISLKRINIFTLKHNEEINLFISNKLYKELREILIDKQDSIQVDLPYVQFELRRKISEQGNIFPFIHFTVPKGYSWDGCSPKFKLFGKIVGTYDGKIVNGKPITYYASLIHDSLYQNLDDLEVLGIDKKIVDLLFYLLLIEAKFKYAAIYYLGVRIFGRFYHNLNN